MRPIIFQFIFLIAPVLDCFGTEIADAYDEIPYRKSPCAFMLIKLQYPSATPFELSFKKEGVSLHWNPYSKELAGHSLKDQSVDQETLWTAKWNASSNHLGFQKSGRWFFSIGSIKAPDQDPLRSGFEMTAFDALTGSQKSRSILFAENSEFYFIGGVLFYRFVRSDVVGRAKCLAVGWFDPALPSSLILGRRFIGTYGNIQFHEDELKTHLMIDVSYDAALKGAHTYFEFRLGVDGKLIYTPVRQECFSQ